MFYNLKVDPRQLSNIQIVESWTLQYLNIGQLSWDNYETNLQNAEQVLVLILTKLHLACKSAICTHEIHDSRGYTDQRSWKGNYIFQSKLQKKKPQGKEKNPKNPSCRKAEYNLACKSAICTHEIHDSRGYTDQKVLKTISIKITKKNLKGRKKIR